MLCKLRTSTDAASIKLKRCASNYITVGFMLRLDGKPFSDREVMKTSHVANSMYEMVIYDYLFVAILPGVMRYVVPSASECIAVISKRRVTDVFE